MGVVSTLIAALGPVEALVVLLGAVAFVLAPGVPAGDLVTFVPVVGAVLELPVDDPQPPMSARAQQASATSGSLFIDLDSCSSPFDQPNSRRKASACRLTW